jgi:UDP-glucose 4-epimerase
MYYLVTGGAGFIGSHIVDELLFNNHEVLIIDNFSTGKHDNLPTDNKNLRFTHGSITDIKFLKDMCESVDGVFHEAAITSIPLSIKDPVTTSDVNIHGTHRVLIAARDAGIKKVVFASSCSVYGEQTLGTQNEALPTVPKTPYAVSKYNGEKFMRLFSNLYGMTNISLRYFNVYGPRQDAKSNYSAVIPKFINKIIKNKSPIIYGDGMQIRDFVYVKDVAKANLLAMEKSPVGVYNIASGVGTNINLLGETISNILSSKFKPIYKSKRIGDIANSIGDISLARNTFGYSPNYTLSEGLKETIEWYKK